MCVVILNACYGPRRSADDDGPGIAAPVDLFAPDAAPAPACTTPDPSPLSQLAIRVRTTPYGGHFAPRNVGAIWIERADGSFVKTVERWGQIRAKWLARFASTSSNNVVDAITGATLVAHAVHEPVWDLTDLARCEVPAGDYQVLFELTDRDGPGEWLAVPFSKDQSELTVTPGDTRTFHDLQIQLH